MSKKHLDEHDIARMMDGTVEDILKLPFEEFKPAVYGDIDRIQEGLGRVAGQLDILEKGMSMKLTWQGHEFEVRDVISIFQETLLISPSSVIGLNITINTAIKNVTDRK